MAGKPQPPKLEGKVSIKENLGQGGVYVRETVLEVVVTGGDPQPEMFEWTLPDGHKLLVRETSGDYSATGPTIVNDGKARVFKLMISNKAPYNVQFTATNPRSYTVSRSFGDK